jgi:hypothetical protein
VAIVAEPMWLGPGFELRLAVPRGGWICLDDLAPYVYCEACADVEEHGGSLVTHRSTSGTSNANGRS